MRADDMRGSRQPASTEPPTRMTDAAQDATTAEAFVPLRWERFGPERQVLVTFVLPGAIPDPVWDAMVEDELKSPDLRFVLTVTVPSSRRPCSRATGRCPTSRWWAR